jgi:hypothetical protein
MKLTLNRREQQEGLFRKSTVYYLDITLEVTPEERALINKHGWEDQFMAEGMFKTGIVLELNLGSFLGKPSSWGFKTTENLAYFESQLVDSARSLKEQLGAAEGFTSGGPREIEL